MGIYVQAAGRGLRIAPGKTYCLFLDFGSAVKRFGTLDNIQLGAKHRDTNSLMSFKQCEACDTLNHLKSRVCISCGVEFVFKEGISAQSDSSPILSTNINVATVAEVQITPIGSHYVIKLMGEVDRSMVTTLLAVQVVSTKAMADKRVEQYTGKQIIVEDQGEGGMVLSAIA